MPFWGLHFNASTLAIPHIKCVQKAWHVPLAL
jgi:hypothetical protein